MFQLKAKLIYNHGIKGLKDSYLHCSLAAPAIARSASAGQFVTIMLKGDSGPLLRRPFSIHRVEGANIEILYEVVGKGTEILSEKKAGESLDLIGPLGNGFDLSSQVLKLSGSQILVAGGMGVAPLLFLAEKIVTRSQGHKVTSKPLVLIGAKTKNHILCEKEFRDLGWDVKVATDDGSKGFKGRVTELLEEFLLKNHRTRELANQIYACGPVPMLKEISRISKECNVHAQISLEAHMACGIGACLGCVVNTKSGYQRVCKEGPVFDAQGIVWG